MRRPDHGRHQRGAVRESANAIPPLGNPDSSSRSIHRETTSHVRAGDRISAWQRDRAGRDARVSTSSSRAIRSSRVTDSPQCVPFLEVRRFEKLPVRLATS